MNRKLIRPNFGEIKEQSGSASRASAASDAPSSTPMSPDLGMSMGSQLGASSPLLPQGTSTSRRKIAPPEQTNAESFYYLKQMQSKTPMVIVLHNDEKVRGVIEWYDKHCLKINRIKAPNVLVPKHSIKYLYKQDEEPRVRRTRVAKKDDAPVPDVDLPLYD